MHCLWSFCIPYRKTPEQDKNNMSASQIAENPKVESKNAKKDQKQRHDVEDKKLKNLLEKYETAQDDSLKKSEPCPNKNSKPPISKPSGNIGDRIRPTTKPAEKPTDITSQSGIQNQITDREEEKKVEKDQRVMDKVLDDTSQSNTAQSPRKSPEPESKVYKSKFPEQEAKNLPPRQADMKKKAAPIPVTSTPIKKSSLAPNKRYNVEPQVNTVSQDSKKKDLPDLAVDGTSNNGSDYVEEESSIMPAQSDTKKGNPILKKNPLLANMKIGGMNVANYGFGKKIVNNPLLAMTPKKHSQNATPNKSTTPAKSDKNESSRNESVEPVKAQDNKRGTINNYPNSRRTPNKK